MTFAPDVYYYWHKEYPMFWQWAQGKDNLFLPKAMSESDELKQHSLTSKVYVLMKRLQQSYKTILTMPMDERDELFEMEMKLLEEEQRQAKEK